MASIITATAHGLAVNETFKFANVLPTDSGVDEATTYYVLTVPTADTFTFSESEGGTAFVLDHDITDGSIVTAETYTEILDDIQDVPDLTPPSKPTGFLARSVFRGIWCSWDEGVDPPRDMAFYEVRWKEAAESNWHYAQVRTTNFLIANLNPDLNADLVADAVYTVQVRAVDTTGNVYPHTREITASAATNIVTTTGTHYYAAGDTVVFPTLTGGVGLTEDSIVYYVIADSLAATTLKVSTSLGGAEVDITTNYTSGSIQRYPYPSNYITQPDDGWTDAATVTPSMLDGDMVELASLNTTHLSALDAGIIKTGHLLIATNVSDYADGIKVYDSGTQVGLWNENGLYIYSNTDPTDYIRLYNGGLTVYLNGSPVTAIDQSGLNASAITFGALPGGANVVKNASFELAAYSAPAETTMSHDTTAEFNADEYGSNVNITVSNALTMTAAAF